MTGVSVPNTLPRLIAEERRNAERLLRTAINEGWSIFGMVGGVGDTFGDETGIDGAAAVAASYDAVGKWFANLSVPALIDRTAGTIIGNATSNGGLSAAFDGTTDQHKDACAMTYVADKTHPLLLGKDWGEGNAKSVSQVVVRASSSHGFREHVDGYRIDIKLQGSDDNTAWTDLGGGDLIDANGAVFTLDGLPDVAHRSHRIHLNTTDEGSGYQHYLVAELQFFEKADPAAMTLPTVAFDAGAAPVEWRGVLLIDAASAPIYGTGVIVEASDDDGASWTEAEEYAELGMFDAETRVLHVLAGFDGAGDGSIRWRVRTDDSQEIKIKGWWGQWR